MFVSTFFNFFFLHVRNSLFRRRFRLIGFGVATLAGCGLFAACAVGPPSACADWNTLKFFEDASVRVVSACLAAGADPNAADERQRTALMFTAALGKEKQALALLRQGAAANARDDLGNGPLYYAVAHTGWSRRLAAALLAADADAAAHNTQGQTALHVAVMDAKPSMPETSLAIIDALLAAGADVNAQTNQGETPLHYALMRNYHAPFATRLLASGADIAARDQMGSTPLHYAAGGPSFNAVALLLAAGANAKAKDRHDSTPLHRAAYAQSPRTAMALLAAGADPNARNRFGATPLHIAATWHTDPAFLRALIVGGAVVDARDLSGGTPLHRGAYWSGVPAIVATLLDAGAEPTAVDHFDDTAHDFAAKRNAPNAAISALLQDAQRQGVAR